jgi:uncharacterized membrane protein
MRADSPLSWTREALKSGWEGTLANLKPLLFIGVVGGALSMMNSALSGHRGTWIIVLAVQFAQAVVGLVFLRVLFKIAEGERVEMYQLPLLSEGFLNYLVTLVLVTFVVAVGFALLIVPGVYLGLTYGLAPLLAADKRLRPVEAIQESRRLTDGVKVELLGVVAILMLVNLGGLLALGVGLLLTVPTTGLAVVLMMRRLQERAGVAPATHATPTGGVLPPPVAT